MSNDQELVQSESKYHLKKQDGKKQVSSEFLMLSTWACNFLLMYNHTFSIIFKSGDCEGQLMHFSPFLAQYCLVKAARCTGALSS